MIEYEEYPPAEFTDFDDLRYQWRQFVNDELQAFKLINSSYYGTGCACDLQKVFETGDTSPEFIMKLDNRITDCASECIYSQYMGTVNKFLLQFTNMSGVPMSTADLGEEEQLFFNDFEKVAKQRAIFNSWDLWRIDGLKNTK